MAWNKKPETKIIIENLLKAGVAISSCALLFACGGDSGSSSAPEKNELVSSVEDLEACSNDLEGDTVFVKKEKSDFVCLKGEWINVDSLNSYNDEDESSSSTLEDAEESSSSTGKKKSSSSCEDCEDEVSSSGGTDKAKSSSSVKDESSSSDSAESSSSQSSLDGESSSSTLTNEENSSASELPGIVEIKDVSISGVSQKGPFAVGSAVKLYELDGVTYAQTGKSFTGKITTDEGKFSVSNVTLVSQYALLETSGYFRNEITGSNSKGQVSLNAFTDLSDRKTVNINLLTHLEYERAMYLARTGMDVASAKKQAATEVLKAFGIEGEFASSEDLDIFGKSDGNAALLALSVLTLRDLNETDLTEFLTKFAIDIESDGSWDDEQTKAKIADWAASKDLAGELAPIRSNIEMWNLGTVPDFEKYVRNFWYTTYGLGECDSKNEGEILAVKNEHSSKYGTQTRYICKDDAWVEATNVEKDFYKSGKDKGVDGELWTGLVTGEKYKYDEKQGEWKIADGFDKTLNNACTEKREGAMDKNKWETPFYCTANGWVNMTEWRWDIPKEARLNPEITYGTMTDERDNKVYKTVKIGNQTWMAENLNYAAGVKTPRGSWCEYYHEKNCAETAGRLYTWSDAIDSAALYDGGNGVDCGCGKTCSLPAKVQGVCPPGWHMPTKTEWETLFNEVGGQSTAGKTLKSQTGWGRTFEDAYGFSALPVGSDIWNPIPLEYGNGVEFWSATEYNSNHAYSWILDVSDKVIQDDDTGKGYGKSVRCLQD
ncbi:fibrobacter succinogenes major paralogous domain-containing protein [uncultured Fibrobacter sp.]|uniref:fibrobacter succinogenes major paralogous domain-containing protein n=1 Tax=uncultured Fibrobacter sp. TaxID=261512 RepID=UPI002636ADB9|nr:fibrobacter succinogenes major paralogous domain-containing protein [uncultured Fibrobacter sp.]